MGISNVPTLFAIFGVTGDLSRRKLIPALFDLYEKGRMPQSFQIVGFSRDTLKDDAFRVFLRDAIAEGFTVMKKSGFDLDLAKIADVYNHKSVIESRLVGWLKDAFEKYGQGLDEVSASAEQTGEAAWTVEAAKELGIPVSIIEGAFQFRVASQTKPSYEGKIISALRNQFGGHDVK